MRFPLPVARLHRRSFNAKSAKDRHDTAYFAWEVSVRLGVAAAPPTGAASLARASAGAWCAALKPKERPLDDPALLLCYALLTETATGTRSERKTVSPRDLLDALPAYRNKVLGHGSARQPSFYEEAGRVLLAALESAWREHLFLPADALLAHVDSVALDATGGRVARALDLSTETPVVVDGGTTRVPDTVLPRRLYLQQASSWRALHPWLLYDEEAERLWCFNGLGRRAEYLDYASGETLGGAELERAFQGSEDALRSLLDVAAAPSDPAAEVPPPDERRFGDYEVLGKLGEGGMGAVYLARQASLGRTVALKMLPPDRAKDPVAVGRFGREVRALARCEHPNVVKIYASGEARGTHYYAMEYVDGADLARVARALSSSPDFESAVSSACESARGERSELFPGVPHVPRRAATAARGEDRWRQMARFFAQGARGLGHLHENGIVHRDISPANIMVTWPDERAVIMDLGLAAVENASVTLTRDKSAILGTLRYIAPEQLQRHLVDVDRRIDVYSFGATMYELLGGRPIFDGETEPRLIAQVLREEPRLLAKLEPRLPIELAHIVHKAIEKDPARRYASAAELAADLEAFLAGEPVTARAPTAGYRVRRWMRRRRELLVGGTAGLALAAGIGIWAVARRHDDRQELRVLEAVSRCDSLQTGLAALGDQTPAGIPAMEAWLARAAESIDGSRAVPGLDELRTELDRLRAAGTPLAAEESARLVAADPRLSRAARIGQLAAWAASIHAARTGSAQPRFDESTVRLPATAEDWRSVNESAWKFVRPDRVDHDQEMVGLAQARLALRLVAEQEPASEYLVRDTLAWALFAAGRDEEALTEIRRAAQDAPEGDRPSIQVARLEQLVAAARSPEQVRIAEHTARASGFHARALELEVERRMTVKLEDPALRQRYESLVQLVGELELYAAPEFGRIARVRRWLESARTLRARSLEDEQAKRAWREVAEAVAADPRFAGLRFEPQLGLVPIGLDPASKLPEFVHLPTGAVPERRADGTLDLDEDHGAVLVLLPGGACVLGAQTTDPDEAYYDPDATPEEAVIHTVRLDPFFAGKHELTLAQWQRITGREPNVVRPGSLRADRFATRRNPVENVTHDEAERALANVGLALPTEAQFEYAGRGGSTTPWWPGEDPLDLADAGNVRDQAYCSLAPEGECESWNDGWLTHAPVGFYRANGYGLHDTAGNVWEWCRDHDTPPEALPQDGTGLRLAGAFERKRAMRGGGWASQALHARAAHRDHDEPGHKSVTLGVRAVRRLEGVWSTADGRSSDGRAQ